MTNKDMLRIFQESMLMAESYYRLNHYGMTKNQFLVINNDDAVEVVIRFMFDNNINYEISAIDIAMRTVYKNSKITNYGLYYSMSLLGRLLFQQKLTKEDAFKLVQQILERGELNTIKELENLV